MKEYFKIPYIFDINEVHDKIEHRLKSSGASYACVADGVILATAHSDPSYLQTIRGSLFNICDSHHVPNYVKCFYGDNVKSISGEELFLSIIKKQSYNMAFIGSTSIILNGLRNRLTLIDKRVNNMLFKTLPYCEVDKFDYKRIAKIINKNSPDIVWISLGAPKQEIFMANLAPYIKRGILIAVGAVFGYQSGIGNVRRAPQWMVKLGIEFVFRIFQSPNKQIKRCLLIIRTLPKVFYSAIKSKYKK